MKITCVMPAHNEEGTLEGLVKTLVKILEHHDTTKDYEIIIVDDNSTDSTGNLADFLSQGNAKIKVIHRTEKPGFGDAIKTGFKQASGDVIVPVMGDLSDDPEDVPKLVKKIEEGYDIAYGSRFTKGGGTDGYPPIKMVCNRSFNNLARLLFGIRHKDITNAFKAYRREVLDKIGIDDIKSKGFDITVEIPLRAHIFGFKSAEVPVMWHGRERGISKLKLSRNGPLYGKRLLQLFVLSMTSAIGKYLKRG